MPPERLRRAGALLLCVLAGGPAFAQEQGSDDFQFFQKEATLVTPARRPTTAANAPATTYVVTSDDIRDSGAQTLWDALRAVPGVDVMSERTSQGDVSIRGLNQSLNNRTLVLLDGKTVLNGFLDFTDWETIPVTMEEIDRIEVVEGPTSSMYGGNAVSGVINIITKSPEQLKGGLVSYTGGERNTQMGTAMIGDRKGAQAYKLDLGWRSTNMFSDASRKASRVGKAHGLWSVDLPSDAKWSVSGGAARHDVDINDGPRTFDDGETGFLRTDLKRRGTSARFFWNWGQSHFRDYPIIPIHLKYDTYDLDLTQTADLPHDNGLTAGASYRRNTATSDIFAPGVRRQDLFALYFEDEWRPSEEWSVVLGGRGDHHPLAGWSLSPRGSVIYAPVPAHTFRLTASSAFRNPTLYEDYVTLEETFAVNSPPFTAVRVDFPANPDLKPERIQFLEAAYRGSLDRLKISATGFVYRLTDVIRELPATTDTSSPPVAVQTTRIVNGGETKAIGGELAAELPLATGLSSLANYSYQSLIDQHVEQTTARSAPRHKVNVGMRYKREGWTLDASGDWVGKTYWSDGSSAANPKYLEVRAYFMLNVRAGYRFSGRWDGLEAAVSGFNVADRHYETLPTQSATAGGLHAERVESRWSGTLTYRFGL
jgi:iron complex outermembrane receptor protein